VLGLPINHREDARSNSNSQPFDRISNPRFGQENLPSFDPHLELEHTSKPDLSKNIFLAKNNKRIPTPSTTIPVRHHKESSGSPGSNRNYMISSHMTTESPPATEKGSHTIDTFIGHPHAPQELPMSNGLPSQGGKNEEEMMMRDAPFNTREPTQDRTDNKQNNYETPLLNKRLGLAADTSLVSNQRHEVDPGNGNFEVDSSSSKIVRGGSIDNKHVKQRPPTLSNHNLSPNHRHISENTEDYMRRPQPEHVENPNYFTPIHPPIISSEGNADFRIPSSSLTVNDDRKLTFDRITPEHYDDKPWMPLFMDRPNLEKRPRVDLVLPGNEKVEPQIIWNPRDEEEDGMANRYFGYGVESGKSGVITRVLGESDGKSDDGTKEESRMSGQDDISSVEDVKKSKTEEEKDYVSDLISPDPAGGFKPAQIPAYTLVIPHIPNPPAETTTKKLEDQDLKSVDEDLTQNMMKKVELEQPQIYEKEDKEPEKLNAEVPIPHMQDEILDAQNYNEDLPTEEPKMKIYKLDPDAVDVVPDTLGNAEHPLIVEEKLKLKLMNQSQLEVQAESQISRETSEEKSNEQDLKSTTDVILSTLSNLNLIKTSSKVDTDGMGVTPSMSQVMGPDGVPLFPPVRSYVGVNQPIRPRPTESSSPEIDYDDDTTPGFWPSKKLRLHNKNRYPELPAELIATASLDKVISMMMSADSVGEGSRQLTDDPPVLNITKQNIHLLIANRNKSEEIDSKNSTEIVTTTAATIDTSKREEKSYNRNAKINEDISSVQNIHVPVPLMIAPDKSTRDMSGKPQRVVNSLKINKNSPVYRFKLKKGQSVEDLLQEIFQNYTDGVGTQKDDMKKQIVPVKINEPIIEDQMQRDDFDGPDFSDEILETLMPLESTTMGSMNFNHHVDTAPPNVSPTTQATDLDQKEPTRATVLTSTSVVINESSDDCPMNNTFKCVSTGRCISGKKFNFVSFLLKITGKT